MCAALTILSSLKLAWPPSTKQAMQVLVVNGLQLEAARPECVAAHLRGDDGEELDVPLFYLMAAAKVALPLLLLLVLASVRWVLTFAFRHTLRELPQGRESEQMREHSQSLSTKFINLQLQMPILHSLPILSKQDLEIT